MARPLFRAPPGTRDILAPESTRRRKLVGRFADLAERSGFSLLESPIFESVDVFRRLGESTDVVSKELFEFHDRSRRRRHFALRPEVTAGVCRAFVQHRPPTPWKVWYEGPQFRYERPQAGRYRQFSQVGVETLGTDDYCADVEIITLGLRLFEALGLRRVRLMLNTLGDAESRPAYRQALAEYLRGHIGELSEQSLRTMQRNPLRVLDSKRPADQAVIERAPRMVDFLSGPSAEHFAAVREGLDRLSVEYEVSPRLVRGLDYYSRTTFEYTSDALGSAQNAVGGGGRYDRLVEDLGGPPTPGIGLALGVDRIILACDSESVFAAGDGAVQVFVVDVTGGAQATKLCDRLRRAGLGADRAFDRRSMKAQMKRANRSGARVALIVGPDELAAGSVSVRDLRSNIPQHQVPLADTVATVAGMLPEKRPKAEKTDVAERTEAKRL